MASVSPASALEGEVGVAGVEVDADGVTAVAGGDGPGGEGAGEGVEDDAGAPAGAGVKPVEAEAIGAGVSTGRPAGGGLLGSYSAVLLLGVGGEPVVDP